MKITPSSFPTAPAPLERVTLGVQVQTQDQKVLLKLMPKNMKNNFLEEKIISLVLSLGRLYRTVP